MSVYMYNSFKKNKTKNTYMYNMFSSKYVGNLHSPNYLWVVMSSCIIQLESWMKTFLLMTVYSVNSPEISKSFNLETP